MGSKFVPEAFGRAHGVNAAPGRSGFFQDQTAQSGTGAVVCGAKTADASAKDRNVIGGRHDGSHDRSHDNRRLRCRTLVCPRYVMVKPSGDGILSSQ